MFYPDFKEFKRKARKGNLIPVYKEIYADMETPVSAFCKIDDGVFSFLLESVEGGEKWARYSFLGSSPSMIFKSKGSEITIISNKKKKRFRNEDDPLSALRDIMEGFKTVKVHGLPRFFGGAVGFIGYDFVRFFEKIPDYRSDELNLPDAYFMLTDTLLIFDNVSHKIKIVSNCYIDSGKNLGQLYRQAQRKITNLIEKLRKKNVEKTWIEQKHSTKKIALKSNFSKKSFENMIIKAKGYVKRGDLIQVVLSQRMKTRIKKSPFDVYRALRIVNPSPYMFYLKFDEFCMVGSSPEVLVRVEDNKVELRPIAGTRKRGETEQEDRKLENELLSDTKERAEHIMLVDLGRNDLGRIAKTGSVEVNELMVVERYSHVMHIVSNIRGILDDGKNAFDVIRACFPAGTVTGAPKVRAMEIIEELEPTKRGPYAGAVGYFSFTGNMDTCITIRTLYFKNNEVYIQAGAGIVFDSKPELEYKETINKAKAMVKALELANG
ncbi:MAG: anthranilate synthase component I [Candidatus Schekmanbacteria bacterium RBG_16_38_10]|uniref:Anthranilate synthase component 1 n=1 Tax=Candidatus Schekmanbacteria bacterium RBG_16_38_10 TaxID=1817879 RepID=A0A1F7RQP9_9BACT|nr:MAG: anthranilate synthase component I [Candidatus Schekmanbacteria bacterium RBG_16_38_10]